jgi:hypothetical protein
MFFAPQEKNKRLKMEKYIGFIYLIFSKVIKSQQYTYMQSEFKAYHLN